MGATPLRAGWYADPVDRGSLRFWDGQDWTDRRVPSAVALPPPPDPPAGWYPDPYHLDHVRYWDGQRWTEHRRPHPDTGPPPPNPPTGWYPDPEDRNVLRYWEAGRWTERRSALTPADRPRLVHAEPPPEEPEPGLTAEPTPEPTPEATTEPEPVPEAAREPEPEAIPEAAREQEPATDPGLRTDVPGASEPERSLEPEIEPEVEPAVEPSAEAERPERPAAGAAVAIPRVSVDLLPSEPLEGPRTGEPSGPDTSQDPVTAEALRTLDALARLGREPTLAPVREWPPRRVTERVAPSAVARPAVPEAPAPAAPESAPATTETAADVEAAPVTGPALAEETRAALAELLAAVQADAPPGGASEPAEGPEQDETDETDDTDEPEGTAVEAAAPVEDDDDAAPAPQAAESEPWDAVVRTPTGEADGQTDVATVEPTETRGWPDAAPARAAEASPRRRAGRGAFRSSATWLRLGLALSAGMTLVAATAAIAAAIVNRQFFAGARSGLASAAADDRLATAVVVVVVADLLLAAAWAAWVRRGAAVVVRLRPRGSWPWGGRVPSYLAPLLRPRASALALRDGAGDRTEPPSRRQVNAWWATFVLSLLVAAGSELVFPRSDAESTLASWERYYVVVLVALALHLTAAALAWRLVTRTTDALVASRVED